MTTEAEKHAMLRKLQTGMVASCNCGTKSPDACWHSYNCPYLVLNEAYTFINDHVAALPMPKSALEARRAILTKRPVSVRLRQVHGLSRPLYVVYIRSVFKLRDEKWLTTPWTPYDRKVRSIEDACDLVHKLLGGSIPIGISANIGVFAMPWKHVDDKNGRLGH